MLRLAFFCELESVDHGVDHGVDSRLGLCPALRTEGLNLPPCTYVPVAFMLALWCHPLSVQRQPNPPTKPWAECAPCEPSTVTRPSGSSTVEDLEQQSAIKQQLLADKAAGRHAHEAAAAAGRRHVQSIELGRTTALASTAPRKHAKVRPAALMARPCLRFTTAAGFSPACQACGCFHGSPWPPVQLCTQLYSCTPLQP